MNFSFLIKEFLGTFLLTGLGTLSIVLHELHYVPLGNWGIALVFGVVVAFLSHSKNTFFCGDLNPLVTLLNTGNWNIKSFRIAAQVCGSILASLVLHFSFPSNENLGSTLPKVGFWNTFALESIGFLLLFLAIRFPFGKRSLHWIQPAIVVFLLAGLIGPYTGASLNLARSFGPALISGNTSSLLPYLLAHIGFYSLISLTNFNKKQVRTSCCSC